MLFTNILKSFAIMKKGEQLKITSHLPAPSGYLNLTNKLILSTTLNIFLLAFKIKAKILMEHNELIKLALEAKKFAYAPYSNFKVGAAILTNDGEVFTGCNIENSSYSLTICAERVAIFKAYSAGKKKFKSIAIVSDSKNYISPCGACRQVLMDLAGGELEVILANSKGETRILKLNELLPFPFGSKDLKRKVKK